MLYNKQYFIEKFSKIPAEKIGITRLESHCALHHCGVTVKASQDGYVMTDEARALGHLLAPLSAPGASTDDDLIRAVYRVNDTTGMRFGLCAKDRILNALAQLPD